jgi:hypothetical protein
VTGSVWLRALCLRNYSLKRRDARTCRMTQGPDLIGDPLRAKPAAELRQIDEGAAAPHDPLCLRLGWGGGSLEKLRPEVHDPHSGNRRTHEGDQDLDAHERPTRVSAALPASCPQSIVVPRRMLPSKSRRIDASEFHPTSKVLESGEKVKWPRAEPTRGENPALLKRREGRPKPALLARARRRARSRRRR